MESLDKGYVGYTPIDHKHFPMTSRLNIPFVFEFSYHAFSVKKNHGVMRLLQYTNDEIFDKLDHIMFKILSRNNTKNLILNNHNIKFLAATKDQQIGFIIAAEFNNDVFKFSLITAFKLKNNQYQRVVNSQFNNNEYHILIEADKDESYCS